MIGSSVMKELITFHIQKKIYVCTEHVCTKTICIYVCTEHVCTETILLQKYIILVLVTRW